VNENLMGRTPPGVVFQKIDGARTVLKLNATAPWEVYELGRTGLIQKIREAIIQGVKIERWSSNNAAFEELGMHWSYGKRLMTGKGKDVKGMGDGDLECYAHKLGIQHPPRVSAERHLLAGIIQRMREQRRLLGEEWLPGPFGERDFHLIEDLVPKVMHIDQDSAHSPIPWEKWLAAQLARAKVCFPVEDAAWFRPRLICLGDCLVAFPFLDNLFKRHLFDRLFDLIEVQKNHPLRRKAMRFQGLVAQVQELARAFRNSCGNGLNAVAQAYPATRPETIEDLLSRVGLKADHFRGDEAVLGHLILESPTLCPLFLELFHDPDGDFGTTRPSGRSKP
jgi:hypothetical protein